MRSKKKKPPTSPPPVDIRKSKPPFAAFVMAGVCLAGVIGTMVWQRGATVASKANAAHSDLELHEIPFDGRLAYQYLEQVCDLGRRPSGSEGMAAQQRTLEEHFTKLGGIVHRQEFRYAHPQTGDPVPMTNLIVQWAPERPERILLACHYDTLPHPMLDPHDPFGEFVGANDGASGVALLMALGHEMPKLLVSGQKHFGVDFVFLDGEEFIFTQRGGRYFVGSEYFSKLYETGQLPYQGTYCWGVLLDMIGDADLQIPQEANGRWWRDTQPLLRDVYDTAERLGIREFVHRRGQELQDDHIMLHNVGKIPTIDLIDFDYPSWHTMGDTPDKCSALSLAKVGWVIHEWLKTATSPGEETR